MIEMVIEMKMIVDIVGELLVKDFVEEGYYFGMQEWQSLVAEVVVVVELLDYNCMALLHCLDL